jgi:hypothetical protein
MAAVKIDQDSLVDNREKQVEFTAKIDSDDCDFAVKYAVLRETSGDEPDNDALELFERFRDEILDVFAELADLSPTANLVIVDEDDLESGTG